VDDFRFANPTWLLAGLPVVLMHALAWRRRRLAVAYSSSQLLDDLPVTWAQRIRRGLPLLRLAGLLLLVVALARPQLGLREFRMDTEGVAIVMCIDRSGSMQALDFELDGRRADRLAAVKQVFRDFVAGQGELGGRPNDVIGLVAFGGFAESKTPLTLDHEALLDVLETVQIAQPIRDGRGRVLNERYLREEQATAIGDAVALAVDRLKDAPAKSKVIILLSDGENTSGVVEPAEAAEAAREFGIKIYTIGVGTTGYAPFPAQTVFGRTVLVDQLVQLDEQTLKMLAETTGGKYFNAQDASALADVYHEIDQLEKTVSEGLYYLEYRELFAWFLLAGLGLVLGEVLLSSTRFLTWP